MTLNKSQIESIKDKIRAFDKRLGKEIETHDFIASKLKGQESAFHRDLSGKVVSLRMAFGEMFIEELKERKGK